MIVNEGLAWLVDKVVAESNQIGVGTGTTPPTGVDGDLEASTLKKAATTTEITPYKLRMSTTYTTGEAHATLAEVGSFIGGSTTMLSRSTFTPFIKTSALSLKVLVDVEFVSE